MKNSLQQYALDINDLLSEYILLHNKLQKKTNSVWGIFKPINFEELRQTSQEIQNKLEDKVSDISGLRKKATNNSEKEFTNCLLEYAQALLNTLNLFKKMASDLLLKSSGGKLSLPKHMENSRSYKDSISQYQIIGNRLNELYKNL